MIKVKYFRFIFIGLYFGITLSKSYAASPTKSQTRIRSDIIDIKRNIETINFIGNVVVEKDDSSLLAQNMTIYYHESKNGTDNKNQKSSVRKIEARNNVKIFSDEFIANGDTGEYDPAKELFVLEKNVTVNNGVSIASGDKFIYNLKTKKGNFVGKKTTSSLLGTTDEDKRVTVIIGEDVENEKPKSKKRK